MAFIGCHARFAFLSLSKRGKRRFGFVFHAEKARMKVLKKVVLCRSYSGEYSSLKMEQNVTFSTFKIEKNL